MSLMDSDDRSTQTSLRDVWSAIRRNRWVVLGVTGCVIALTVIATARATRVYQSETTLRIATNEAGGGVLERLSPLGGIGLPNLGESEINTELGVLRSRQIVEAVVDSLDLHVALLEPEQPRDSVLRVLRAGRDATEGTYTLRLRPDGSYTPVAQEPQATVRIPARVEIGRSFELGTVVLALAPPLRASPPERIQFTVRPFRHAVGDTRQRLLVERHQGGSKLITVSFRNSDPELAAAVPNAVAESFIQYRTGTSKTESRSAVAILREQVTSYQQQLRSAEERLRRYREQQQIASPGEQATQQVRRLAEVQVKVDATRVERDALARLLEQVNQGVQRSGAEAPSRQLAAFPSFIANASVQNIIQALTQLEEERSTLLLRFTPENAQIQRITRRIEELELQLYRLASNYLQSLDKQIASANAVLGQSSGELQQIPAREVELARLAREQKLLEEVYLRLQTQLKEAEIQDAIDRGDTRVIDPALVPDGPVSPRPMVNLILGTALGLLLGLAAAMGREIVDTKVRSRADVRGATGGAPLLGTIPRIKLRADSPNRKSAGARKWIGTHSASPDERRVQRLVTLRQPGNPASEAYRALRTNIAFGDEQAAPQVLIVTSAIPGEGKTTSASNLAITLAQQGRRTLLVDADLRDGLLHRLFGARQEPGLTDVLLRRIPLDEAVQKVEVGDIEPPLHLLPSGASASNPAELLGSDLMRQLIATLRERYESIVFDTPSLNLVTDAAVLGRLADTALLIARAGITDTDALQHATAELRRLRVPVAGVILNDFDTASGRRPSSNRQSRNGGNGRQR